MAIALMRFGPLRITRRNWPDFNALSALPNSARVSYEPVPVLMRVSAKLILPLRCSVEPSASFTATFIASLLGHSSFFSATARSTRSFSFSEMLNCTHAGSICEIVVRRSVPAATRLPSDLAARLDMPEIGATTRVYPRLRRASRSFASADFIAAAASSPVETASSYSFCPIAFFSARGFRRAASRVACDCCACARASSASALAAWASKGLGSSTNSVCPAFTGAPSANNRFSRMPPTRARTSTSLEPSACPTYSKVTGIDFGWTVNTPTSAGGNPCCPPPGGWPPLHAASTRAAVRAGAMRVMRTAWRFMNDSA